MTGKYYKKADKNKSLKRKIFRRYSVMFTLIVSLLILSVGAIYSIDLNIRTTMLPNANPIFSFEREYRYSYNFDVFGKSFSLNLSDFDITHDFLNDVLHTPSAFKRCMFIIKAKVTGILPYNIRKELNQRTFC